MQVTSTAPVSGVGDQAEFVAYSYSQDNVQLSGDLVYVLDRSVLFLCDEARLGPAPDDATQQSELHECGLLVVSRL